MNKIKCLQCLVRGGQQQLNGQECKRTWRIFTGKDANGVTLPITEIDGFLCEALEKANTFPKFHPNGTIRSVGYIYRNQEKL